MLGWDASGINVNGGAIAIGHPIGASGCRILVTLIHEMIRRDAKRGLAGSKPSQSTSSESRSLVMARAS